jgi:electron transport complex protein RnfA
MSLVFVALNYFFMQNLLLTYGFGFGRHLKKKKDFRFKPAQFAVNSLLLLLSVSLAWGLNQLFVVMLGLVYLRTMLFVLVLVALVYATRTIAGRHGGEMADFLNVVFPANLLSVAMGLMVLSTGEGNGAAEALAAAVGGILGYGAASFLYGEVMARMDLEWVPRAFRGLPLGLVSLGLVSLVFMAVSALLLPGMR